MDVFIGSRGMGIVAAVAIAGFAGAQVTNPGFEDATAFNGWNTTGDAQIQTSALGIVPPEGVNQAFLATFTNASSTPPVAGGSGVSEATLTAALGLNAGDLASFSGGNIDMGSGVVQTVHLEAGQTLTFKWDFLTNQVFNDGDPGDSFAPDPANNDFAFASIVPTGGGGTIFKLADTFDGFVDGTGSAGFLSGLVPTSLLTPFFSETTYRTFSWTAGATGDYLIGVGVAQVTAVGAVDNGVNSGVLADDFQVSNPVPEPASMVGLGILCAGLLRRRGRR